MTRSDGETMREARELLDTQVEYVRHYLHRQIGKPVSRELASAPEIALDNLHRALKAALSRPVTAGAPVAWHAPVRNLFTTNPAQAESWGSEVSVRPLYAAPPAAVGREVTDAMCEAAMKADAIDRIQGFTYDRRHVIRDVYMPHDQQEIWSAPVGGADEYQAFQQQCRIENMRMVLNAALAVSPQNCGVDRTAVIEAAAERLLDRADSTIITDAAGNGFRKVFNSDVANLAAALAPKGAA